MNSLSFDNGDTLPALGLGTWKSEPDEVYEAVKEAIRVGYRHIDCAAIYGNEDEVGHALSEAFAEGMVGREEIWITSKLWNDSHAPEHVRPALESTLSDLGLDYLDLYLIHWPIAFRKGVSFPMSGDDFRTLEERPLEDTWEAMEALKEDGLARHIGVSNFSRENLGSLIESATQTPEMNQVELHPYLQQRELVEFCRARDVHVTAYSPLGSMDRPEQLKGDDEPILLEDPVVGDIADRHDATPAQVLIAWSLHRGTAVIPKSVNPGRIRENFEAAELELTDDDMAEIAALDRDARYIGGEFFTRSGSPYSLTDLWGT